MCFAPQRRALFRHLNFQKWSEREVLLAFSLADVLRTTTACTFSTTSKCASRHNGVQFFISHLARWLCTRRFREPTFSTLRSHKSLEKTHCFATFLPFRASASSFFWLFLFSDLLLTLSLLWSSLFYSSLLSDSSHLCFSSVYIVGSLTSKLPSINKKNSEQVRKWRYISKNASTCHFCRIKISVSHRKKDD